MDEEDGGGLADASAIYKHAAADVTDDRVARLTLLNTPSADGQTQILDEDMQQQTPNKDHSTGSSSGNVAPGTGAAQDVPNSQCSSDDEGLEAGLGFLSALTGGLSAPVAAKAKAKAAAKGKAKAAAKVSAKAQPVAAKRAASQGPRPARNQTFSRIQATTRTAAPPAT